MKSSHGSTRDLASAVTQRAKRAGEQAPSVRGADWRLATVNLVPGDGTVTADGIVCRCEESYLLPTVGDVIVVSQSSSGNWLACGRTATGPDVVGGFRTARKQNDLARAVATPTADPELSFTVAANAVYFLDGWIKYSADVAVDISIDWSIPAGALGEWTGSGASIDTAASANGYSLQVASTDIDALRSFGGAGTGANLTVDIKGTLRTQGTAGTYSLLWSQRVASATATTVYTDSWLRLHRVP